MLVMLCILSKLCATSYTPFRMNATKEHTQLHTTYSRYITLQALFTYYFFLFLFFFFFFASPHPLLKSEFHMYYGYSFPKVTQNSKKI